MTPTIVHHMAAMDHCGHHPNSIEAIHDCLSAGADVIEIDVTALASDDYLLVHDPVLDRETTGTGPVGETTVDVARSLHFPRTDSREAASVPLLSHVVSAILDNGGNTRLQIDFKNVLPLRTDEPLRRLATLIKPIAERVSVSSGADWHLRKLNKIAPWLRLGFDIMYYIDWSPAPARRNPTEPPYTLGAYGYFDDHILARERLWPTQEYLADRCASIANQLPTAQIFYLRHTFVAQCLKEGFSWSKALHAKNAELDVWTLDIGNSSAEANAILLRDDQVDYITTNTPVAMRMLLES